MRAVHAGVFQRKAGLRPENAKPISYAPIAFHLALLSRCERSFLSFEGKLPHAPLILGTELYAEDFTSGLRRKIATIWFAKSANDRSVRGGNLCLLHLCKAPGCANSPYHNLFTRPRQGTAAGMVTLIRRA